MPGLQLHQLRVAALARYVAGSLSVPVKIDLVVCAALFHDMGNILKSDFTTFPDFLGDKDASYWESVKREYVVSYGTNVHEATQAIAREIGLNEEVVSLIDAMGFSRMESIRDSDSIELKIIEYADSRTAPRGVLSLQERLEDARKRYEGKNFSGEPTFGRARWEELMSAAEVIEEQLFSVSSIKPSDVSESVIAPLMEELRAYKIR